MCFIVIVYFCALRKAFPRKFDSFTPHGFLFVHGRLCGVVMGLSVVPVTESKQSVHVHASKTF